MSDRDLRDAIQQMESWLRDVSGQLPEPEVLATWNRRFNAALASATRGEGWEELVAHAHRLATEVEARAGQLAERRDALKVELEAQAVGGRALKGYGASSR